MTVDRILNAIDEEINRLEQARSLLLATTSLHGIAVTKSATKKRRRKLSAVARKKIGDAQRKRWAKQKANRQA